MLKLKKITFSGIGRFVEEQVVDFTRLGSLVQIDGQNNNTNGSSGAGKSTLFNGLDWLLGLSDLSTSTLQSRLTKSHISVSGEFDWDGRNVVITRAKKLSIVVDGEETTGSSKLSEEKLDQILGISRNLFQKLLHRRQGESGWFLDLTPAKMNEVLTDALSLSQISSKIDVIDSKLKEMAQDKASAQSSLQAAQSGLEANQRALDAIGEEPKTDLSQYLLVGVLTKYKEIENKVTHTQNQHKQEKAELETKKPKLVSKPFDSSVMDALRQEESSINVKINELLSQEKDRQAAINKEISKLKLDLSNHISGFKTKANAQISALNSKLSDTAMTIKLGAMAKTEATKIAAQIKTIRAGICYTCQQTWISKSEEDKLLASLGEYKTKIITANDAENNAANLRKEIELVNTKLVDQIEDAELHIGGNIACLIEDAKPLLPSELSDLNAKLGNIGKLKIAERFKEDAHNDEQNKANNQTMSTFFAEQKALASRHQEELRSANKELEEARSQYERLSTELKNHEINLAQYKKIVKNVSEAKKENELKLVDFNSKVVDTEERLNLAEEVKRCLKSYLSCSFDDALDSISETATHILRAVPTMANATVRLEGTKETGEGSIKNQINACIDNDGEIGVPIKSLSGGERSAVDMAVDMAVSSLIAERANLGIDVLFLDEIFGGFDSIGIEHALEMLKTMDKRIVLVEHNPIAKEFIDCKVTVVRDGETSHIENKA